MKYAPFLILFFFASRAYAQEQVQQQQVRPKNEVGEAFTTPFRKGRWLTGLSGSISSNTVRIGDADSPGFTNQFGLQLSSGKFIKDRWLLGGIVNADRSSGTGSLERASEFLLIGPLVSYYLADSKTGSIFLSLSPGYSRFIEESRFDQNGQISQVFVKGHGFGSLYRLGYSYVLHDRVAFDLSFVFMTIWTNSEVETTPGSDPVKERVYVGSISFSFGFNVLL